MSSDEVVCLDDVLALISERAAEHKRLGENPPFVVLGAEADTAARSSHRVQAACLYMIAQRIRALTPADTGVERKAVLDAITDATFDLGLAVMSSEVDEITDAVLGAISARASADTSVERPRALPPVSHAEVERDEHLPSWLDETAAIIRHDGPGGMDQRYCDMVAANLERLADRERALSTPKPEEK